MVMVCKNQRVLLCNHLDCYHEYKRTKLRFFAYTPMGEKDPYGHALALMTIRNLIENEKFILLFCVVLIALMLYIGLTTEPRYDCSIPFENMTKSEIAWCYYIPEEGV